MNGQTDDKITKNHKTTIFLREEHKTYYAFSYFLSFDLQHLMTDKTKIKAKKLVITNRLYFFAACLTKKGETMSDIATRVKAIIVDKLGVDEKEVTSEASFTNDLGADSLDTVELIMEFEKEFNLAIPDDQAEKISTVGEAIAYIEKEGK